MEAFSLVHQGVLFGHLVAFAIALSAVLHADIALLKASRIDARQLADTARTVTAALLALWATGLALMALTGGFDAQALATPKLAAKLVVVSALTANGVALHALAFPILRGPKAPTGLGLCVPLVLGAISSSSWLYASFIGVSRLVAPSMSFGDYIALYGVLLAGAIAIALIFVRPRFARALGGASVADAGASAAVHEHVAVAPTPA